MKLLFALAVFLQDDTLESSLQKLFESLSGDHRKACLKAYDDPNRDAEVFPPGERPGLLIQELSDEQYQRLDSSIKLFLSKDGYAQAMKVAGQSHKKEGLRAYYVNFFGDPAKDKDWAFRVSEHHLTLVHVNSDPDKFGPILLGANPPDLWKEQEEAAIEGFGKLTEADRAKCVVQGRGISGEALGARGATAADLSSAAREAMEKMVEARLRVFSDDQQKKLRKILESRGGIANLRLAFFGEMSKRCADGGRSDWKLEAKGFLLDYESSRGHIHMTLRAAGK